MFVCDDHKRMIRSNASLFFCRDIFGQTEVSTVTIPVNFKCFSFCLMGVHILPV